LVDAEEDGKFSCDCLVKLGARERPAEFRDEYEYALLPGNIAIAVGRVGVWRFVGRPGVISGGTLHLRTFYEKTFG
jgi:hypothetical protein